MNHKETCRQLQAIRKGLADKLGIDLHQKECTYPGECSGTCPKCAREEQILNAALLKKTATVAGLAAGALSLAACGQTQVTGDVPAPVVDEYDEILGGETVDPDWQEPVEISDIPDVYCEDGIIYLNGMVLEESDTLFIHRVDKAIVSIATGEKYVDETYINVTPDGTVLSLSDLIVDREAYEAEIVDIIDGQIAYMNRNHPTKEQYDELVSMLSSYDEAMQLDFCAEERYITIINPILRIFIPYGSSFVDEKYKPTDEVRCTSAITGAVSCYPDELDKDLYKDKYVTDSMDVHNYNGADYAVYKTRYSTGSDDDNANDTVYYLVITEVGENQRETLIAYKLIDEGYNCSYRDFVEMMTP